MKIASSLREHPAEQEMREEQQQDKEDKQSGRDSAAAISAGNIVVNILLSARTNAIKIVRENYAQRFARIVVCHEYIHTYLLPAAVVVVVAVFVI